MKAITKISVLKHLRINLSNRIELPTISRIYLLVIITLFSCQSKITEAELKTYIQHPENGLIQQKQIKNVAYKVTFKPKALMINQELRNKIVTDDLLDSLKEKYSKYLYFMLSVNVNNRDVLSSKAGSVNEFGQAVSQLSFNMNQNAFLVTDRLDTLSLVDYIFPRMFGMTPATNMLFVFEKGDWNNTVSLKLHLNEFGLNTGNTKYKFLVKDINIIPELKYTGL